MSHVHTKIFLYSVGTLALTCVAVFLCLRFLEHNRVSKTSLFEQSKKSIEEDNINGMALEIVRGVNDRSPLTNPQYESTEQASAWLSDEEYVLGLVFGGEARAYPLSVLQFHETINDEMATIPFVISYCPECSSALVYSRQFGGSKITFGNTGALYGGVPLLFDDATGSYWHHLSGISILGQNVGKRLEIKPSSLSTWRAWRSQHTDSRVLSRTEDYLARNASSTPVFISDSQVVGVVVGSIKKAYPISLLQDRVVNDTLADTRLQIVGAADGSGADVYFIGAGTRLPYPQAHMPLPLWEELYPQTLIYDASETPK